MRLCRLILLMSVLVSAGVGLVLAYRVPWLAVVALVVAAAGSTKRRKLDACGTAEFCSAERMEKEGMLADGPGLCVGVVNLPPYRFWGCVRDLFRPGVPSRVACERLVASVFRREVPRFARVRLNKAVHHAIFAPTRAGKGIFFVVNYLLECRDSVICIDPKGENAVLTAEHRRKLGQRVVVLDPFKVTTQTPDTFNPLDGIDRESPLLIDDCRAMANAFVVRTGEEKDPFWNDSAELFICAMIVATCLYAEGEGRSIQAVRTLLTSPERMAAVIKLMVQSKDLDGMVSRLGNQLLNYRENELASVLATANKHLNILDTLAVAASTRASTFDPSMLRRGKMTLYLVLPTQYLRSHGALLRLWIVCMLRACVKEGLDENRKCVLLLDEAASLGRLDVLEDAVDKMAGFGVRLMFIYQSLGQLKAVWKDGLDQSLLSNTSQCFFAVQDQATAEAVSNRLGEETIAVESGGTNYGGSTSANRQDGGGTVGNSWGGNKGWQQQARKLLKPEEVVGLRRDTCLTFTPGAPPLATHLVPYFADRPGKAPGRWRRLKGTAGVWLASALLLGLSITGAWLTAELSRPQYRPHSRAAR